MMMAIVVTIVIILLITNSIQAQQFIRNKRGLSDFFKRFWNIRKKVNPVMNVFFFL